MDPQDSPEPRDAHELLTAEARAWGRLSMVQSRLEDHEREVDLARDTLRKASADVAQLEGYSLRRLRAWLRGVLPGLLEAQRAEVVEALHRKEALEGRLVELRRERDQLEAELAGLRLEEESYSQRLMEALRQRRAQREDPDRSEPAEDREEEAVLLQHDLRDLEEASSALGAASLHLEAARDSLVRIVEPAFLEVISGLALLDLFERGEIRLARTSFEAAQGAVERAQVAVQGLELVRPYESTLETLSEIRDHRFLHGLYHEGQIGRVLRAAREQLETYRERVWEIRGRVRTLKDGLLTRLGDLPATPSQPPAD